MNQYGISKQSYIEIDILRVKIHDKSGTVRNNLVLKFMFENKIKKTNKFNPQNISLEKVI